MNKTSKAETGEQKRRNWHEVLRRRDFEEFVWGKSDPVCREAVNSSVETEQPALSGGSGMNKTSKAETDWKSRALFSINRNQTVHQFLEPVEQSQKPAAFDAWVSAVKEIQRKAAMPNVELHDDPQHNGQFWGN